MADIVMTGATFVEFMEMPQAVRDAAKTCPSRERKVDHDGTTFTLAQKHVGDGYCLTSIFPETVCAECGEPYSASTAPIEPHIYCSAACESGEV